MNRGVSDDLSALAAAALILVVPGISRADSNTGVATEHRRFFGEHLYPASVNVPDPFITTTLTSVTGAGSAKDITVPVYNADQEEIGKLKGNIAFLNLEFHYQQSFGEKFAVRLGASGGARAGTDAAAILAEGVSTIYGYELGGSMKLVEKPKWMLTGTLDLRSNKLYGIDPLAFVRSVIEKVDNGDTNSVAEDSLLTSGNNLRLVAGVRTAWSLSQSFGVLAFVESGLGDHFQEGEGDIAVVNFGLAASYDFNPRGHVPIGLLLSGRYESLSEKGDDLGSDNQQYGLGIFYTGRRDFSVGLDTSLTNVDRAENNDSFSVVKARLVLRYDFN